jgi:hypothetical protein
MQAAHDETFRLRHTAWPEQCADEATRRIGHGAEPKPVAEEIGEQFFAGNVGYIGRIALKPFCGSMRAGDAANPDATERVQGPNPIGIAFDQVIVDGDDMAGTPGPPSEHGGQTGRESFAFAGRHFDQVTAVQGQSTHELNNEWPETKLAIGCFPDAG